MDNLRVTNSCKSLPSITQPKKRRSIPTIRNDPLKKIAPHRAPREENCFIPKPQKGILNQEISEDESFAIILSATDIDGDNLIFSISNGVNISSSLQGASIELIPINNWYGLETFVISVSDGLLQDSQIITVEVNPINDAPVLVTDLNNIIFDEDSSISVDLYAYDLDSDLLIYSISGGDSISAYLNIND